MEKKIEALDDPHKTTYRNTWAFLLEAVNRWPWGRPNGGVIAWPINISEDYIALLKQGEWPARILFLHYGVGMHLFSHRWFVRDWGRRLVAAVLQPLADEIPTEWAETIEWTKRAVGLDP